MTDNTETPQAQPPAEKSDAELLREKRIANLKPAQPGEVRNPNGRPKGSVNRKTIYKRLLESGAFKIYNDVIKHKLGEISDDDLPVTVAEQLGMIDLMKALDGDAAAIERVFNNVDGKLSDKTELSGNLGLGAVLDSISNGKREPIPTPPAKKEEAQCQTKLPTPQMNTKQPQPQN